MQSADKPVTAYDSDLLPTSEADRFQEWLRGQKVKTRTATRVEQQRGILFWARPKNTSAWVSVDRPRDPMDTHLVTHKRLSSLISTYLERPLSAAVRQVTRPPAPAVKSNLVKHLRQLESSNEAPAAPLERSSACASPCADPKWVGIDPAAPGADKTVLTVIVPAPESQKLPVHLEDLRDDFAIHCPLTQRTGESLQDFAVRRWEYAKVMMETRP